MRFCANYEPEMDKIANKFDELKIKYNERDITLFDFLKQHSEQTIIIDIFDLESFINSRQLSRLISILQAAPNLKIKLQIPSFKEIYELAKKLGSDCRENNIAFFFSEFPRDWDTLTDYMRQGVSDIYITEELGFSLRTIRKLYPDVNIRVFPNVAQSSVSTVRDIKSFWIRPEDIQTYEEYVDVYELAGPAQTLGTVYEVYAVDHVWFGNLKEIIIGLDENLDSRGLLGTFGGFRAGCDKKCIKGGSCKMCERSKQLSNTMTENGVVVKLN